MGFIDARGEVRIKRVIVLAALLLAGAMQVARAVHNAPVDDAQVERGRYLITIAGCNTCHTPGYAMSGGQVPEQNWLTGSVIGWKGPWGTTYAGNVRLYVLGMSPQEWVETAHAKRFRPPMPWSSLHHMTSQDLRAIYQFIRYLGAAGEPGKAFVPPGQTPQGPFVEFPGPGQ